MAAKKAISKAIRVADWMTEGVLAVEIFDSIAVARRLMAKHRVNQLPVLDNDRLVGIVTDRDVRDAYPTSLMINRAEEIDRFAEKITVEEVMTHDVFVVRPDTGLPTAVGLLRRHRIGALPVLKNQKLVGIITRSDILDFVLRDGVGRERNRSKPPASAGKRGGKNRRRAGNKAT
ncbi:MAG TPA: CBS domain-containing protein [Phototrophicaceae bacterium]|jgi:acetoin utilization protein AcuB|nr:CBS domain-containing protein [Phototrophicaceae bacterium]